MQTIFDDDEDSWHFPLFVVFSIALATTWVYSVWRWTNLFQAVISSRFFTDQPGDKAGKIHHGHEPHVTIQICSYNEGPVIEETLNRACSIDWPIDKLTVQVLDDSTDPESTDIIEQCIALWRSRGIDVAQLTRSNRVGYKAGSLSCHFDSIKSELVAHLDADHHLEPDFLRRVIPFFFDQNGESITTIGLVQAPWSFYNIHQNLLTECDALALDIHHVCEQTGRSAAYGCFGFNGTGGVWRKTAIEAGGGWTWDTVTEDLSLSYQAAMAGYKFIYVRDSPQRLEVPGNFSAHIQQKHRWTKGFAQVFRMSFWKIIASPSISPVGKWDILCHVTSQTQYASVMVGLLLTPYIVLHGLDSPQVKLLAFLPTLEAVLSAVVACFAKVSDSNGSYKSFKSRVARLRFVIPHLALKCGMSLFETRALLEGLFSNDATFLTTPKGSDSGSSSNKTKRNYLDDTVACAGLFLGIHRLIYSFTVDIFYAQMTFFHIAMWLLNFFLGFALFWVNVGFLREKYAAKNLAQTLRRLTRWRGFLPFLVLLSIHSTVMTYSFGTSFVLAHEDLNSAHFQSLPSATRRGVYFMANDVVLNLTVAFLNSFRHFNPTIPLVLMPYHEFTSDKLRRLNDTYNFQEYFDYKLFKRIDRLAEKFEGGLQYRKLAIWSGPFDEFLFLDIDSLVLDNVDFAFRLLNYTDVATAISAIDDKGTGYRLGVWEDSIDEAGILTPEQIAFSGHTGAILSSKRFATSEELIEKSLMEALRHKEHFALALRDQPLLNYLFVTSGKRYNSFSRMLENDKMQGPKLEVAAECDCVDVTDDHRVRLLDKNETSHPIFFFHWAGDKKRSGGEMPYLDLWRYWHNQTP